MKAESPENSPFPSKSALAMISRAGKSTTNQYLAFQKIENEGMSPKPSKKASDASMFDQKDPKVMAFLNRQPDPKNSQPNN